MREDQTDAKRSRFGRPMILEESPDLFVRIRGNEA
jgi:hypothetical protein